MVNHHLEVIVRHQADNQSIFLFSPVGQFPTGNKNSNKYRLDLIYNQQYYHHSS